MLVPQHAKEALTFRDGPSALTGALAFVMAKHLLDGVMSHFTMEKDIMFGPVITTEAHLAFAGA